MEQGGHTGLSPSGRHLIEILLKRAEDDVTVAVNQGGSGHQLRT